MFFVTDANFTESYNTTTNNTSTPPTPSYEPTNAASNCPVTMPPEMGRIKVEWEKTNQCQGYTYFLKKFTEQTKPLCFKKGMIHNRLGTELCKERRCGEFLDFKSSVAKCYMIHENLTVTLQSHCNRCLLVCKGVYTCMCNVQ